MSRFYVYFHQGGGCDYSIACGQKLAIMPESVKTLAEAEALFFSGDEATARDYQLEYYGRSKVESLESVVILEVADSREPDLAGYFRRKREEEKEAYRARMEVEEKAEYERLQKKFGKGG